MTGLKSFAQTQPHKVRIGAYFGLNLDVYKVNDAGGWLDNSALGFVSGGMEVDFEYTDRYSIGGGLYFKPYAEGVEFKNMLSSSFSNSMSTLQFPVYLRARTYFQNKDAVAYILGGAALAINQSFDSYSFETGT